MPPLAGHDLFGANRPLAEALEREGAGWAAGQCSAFGRRLGGAPLEWGRLANEHPPQLRTHDRFGERIDEVEFHPAWHDLMRMSIGEGLHSLSWTDSRDGAHVARAALFMLAAQVEAGHGCPISMTHAAVPALRASAPALAAEWEPLLTSREYDFGLRPAAEKNGALVGMSMTERQGGSDLRTNTTVARPTAGGEYVLDGQKWFCSAPMSDAFLVLAQAPAGLSCFFLPRVLPDGSRNGFRIERLKDKLGDRSNASSEIVLDGALAQLVGEEGRGVPTIVEMVVHTRLDCVLGSAAGMRAGGGAGDAPRCAPQRLRLPARRAAADAQRPRRPLHRVGGRDRDRAPPRARVRPARARSGRGRLRAARDRGREVLDLQARARRMRPRRSSASAGTASSRSRACRGSTASSRSSRSGRARATSSASTPSGPCAGSPSRRRCSSPRSAPPASRR